MLLHYLGGEKVNIILILCQTTKVEMKNRPHLDFPYIRD